MIFKIQALTKKFGSNVAVDGVNFEIGPGEIFSLIGPNGSGKTTIIKLAAGILQPTSGRVLVGGREVAKEPVQTKAQIGYIPDDPSVWPEMTGEEFLHFTGALYGMDEKDRRKIIPEALEIFRLEGVENQYFGDYSRGNKQKFAILAALLHEPEILLVDEPIVGLDPESAKIAEKLFVNFAKNGGAVLLATHTLPVAQKIADRIGILEKGKLVEAGTFAALRKKSRLGPHASLEEVYLKLTR